MWTLRTSGASPFGRKIKIGADLCGLFDRLQLAPTVTADPQDPIRQINPLGKIPALEIGGGRVLYDSRVILEWLDVQAGGNRIIPSGVARFDALTLQSLADGIMDAQILQIYEGRFRDPATHNQGWLDYQGEKVSRALAHLEAAPPLLSGMVHVGHIALACALGHRDFRFAGDWRKAHPRLVEWLAAFEAAAPAFGRTMPRD